jgi:uncharacterized membrane protein
LTAQTGQSVESPGPTMTPATNRRPLIAAWVLLGIGLGGFLDGILLHQILQVHNMLSNRLPPDTLANAKINMFWDGMFHAFTGAMSYLGLFLLWRAVKRPDVPLSGRTAAGSFLLGWGLFNSTEGLINHEILGIHHVVQRGNHLLWDLLFLASGIALMIIGGVLVRERMRGQEGMARG